jgi:hypothetical protein
MSFSSLSSSDSKFLSSIDFETSSPKSSSSAVSSSVSPAAAAVAAGAAEALGAALAEGATEAARAALAEPGAGVASFFLSSQCQVRRREPSCGAVRHVGVTPASRRRSPAARGCPPAGTLEQVGVECNLTPELLLHARVTERGARGGRAERIAALGGGA